MAERKTTTTRRKTTKKEEVAEVTTPVAEPVVETAAPAEPAATTATPVNMIVEEKAPPVKIVYIDSVIANNQIAIGPGRYITGSGRIFAVPMEQFEGEFMTPLVMSLIDERKFIVLSGLTDEQRVQYNCDYKEGEVVKSEGAFDIFISAPVEKAAELYSELGKTHRELVATRFMDAYFEKHDNRINRERVEALNKISKENDPEGLFTPIIRDINEKSE